MTRLYVQPNVIKNDIKKSLGNIFYGSDVKSKNLTCVNRKKYENSSGFILGSHGSGISNNIK